MNRSRMMALVVVVAGAVFAAACGGGAGSSFCNSGSALSSKMGNCFSSDGGTSTMSLNTCASSSFVSACETAYGKCSSADQTILNDYVTCVNGLSTCTSSTESTWLTAFAQCGTQMTSVSATCQAAMGGLSNSCQ